MGLGIVHLADLHWDTTFAQAPTRWESLRQSLCVMHPDLIVVSGDLTSTGSAQPAALRAVKQALDAMGCEYIVLAGNHDLGANPEREQTFPGTEAYERVPWASTHFAQVFHQPPVLRWSQDGVHVITVSIRQGDPDGSLAQLTATLQALEGPTMVFGHYPLVPIAAQGPLAHFGGREYLGATLDQLAAVLARFPHVVFYGCGHVHVASRRWLWGNTWQYSAGSLGLGASQFFVYLVEDTQLAYFSVLGNGPLTFWDAAGPEPVNHFDEDASRVGCHRWRDNSRQEV
ncbi:MAG: metallophosphoesterase [Sulfobacillus thermosulfidooxidans]|uniref:Metallophosphoesterase n=1 Tax=Sulfobacillus thermosulfidooxidans TaxID=28034 RepID=A0A2T2WTP1_SULTH|nr:MAG: metallophosphoesterase [Sulfobacillus thermosulfidooxidans]